MGNCRWTVTDICALLYALHTTSLQTTPDVLLTLMKNSKLPLSQEFTATQVKSMIRRLRIHLATSEQKQEMMNGDFSYVYSQKKYPMCEDWPRDASTWSDEIKRIEAFLDVKKQQTLLSQNDVDKQVESMNLLSSSTLQQKKSEIEKALDETIKSVEKKKMLKRSREELESSDDDDDNQFMFLPMTDMPVFSQEKATVEDLPGTSFPFDVQSREYEHNVCYIVRNIASVDIEAKIIEKNVLEIVYRPCAFKDLLSDDLYGRVSKCTEVSLKEKIITIPLPPLGKPYLPEDCSCYEDFKFKYFVVPKLIASFTLAPAYSPSPRSEIKIKSEKHEVHRPMKKEKLSPKKEHSIEVKKSIPFIEID